MDNAVTVTPETAAEEETIINSYGDPVRKRFVRPEILLEDELVKELLAEAHTLHEHIAKAKAAAFDKVTAFNALLAQEFNVASGGRRGGVALTSFDGLKRVVVSVANTVTFGP